MQKLIKNKTPPSFPNFPLYPEGILGDFLSCCNSFQRGLYKTLKSGAVKGLRGGYMRNLTVILGLIFCFSRLGLASLAIDDFVGLYYASCEVSWPDEHLSGKWLEK